MNIVRIFFLILLFLFPFGELLRFSITNDLAVSIIDIIIFSIVVLWFLFTKKKLITTQPLSYGIFGFILASVFSLAINSVNYEISEFFTSFLYLLRWISYACLYFVVSEFDLQFKKKIVKFMVAAGGIFVVFGFIQYFFYPNLRNLYYAGWDEHLYRMFSTFLDPNFAGAFFVLYLFFIAGLFFKEKENKTRAFFIVVGITTVIAIFLTYSRSAYIMYIAGVLTFLVLQKKIKILLIFFSLFLLGIFFLSKLPQSEGTNLLRIASTKARLETAQNAFIIFKDNLILGVGFNAYRYAQYKYGFLEENLKKENHAGAGTDNSFLFIAATTGILGFLAYVNILFSVLKYTWNKNLFFFCSIVGLCIDALFVNSLFYPFLMMWVWIMLGLIENT